MPDETPPTSDLMTVAELAAHARLSKMTVYRLIYSKEIPAMRLGRAFRVRRADWEAYLEGAKNHGPDVS